MKDFGIQMKPTINKQGNIQGFRFIHEETQTDLKASEVDRKIKLHNIFKLEDKIVIKEPAKEEILSDSNLSPVETQNMPSHDFKDLLYRISAIYENEQCDDIGKKKRKRHLKR